MTQTLPERSQTPGAARPERGTAAAVALPLAWWPVFALLALLSAAALATSYVNHDAAWYLYMADRILRGATAYRDVIDTNPPLIVWLTIVPAWLARLGIPAIVLFKSLVFAAAIGCTAACARLAPRAWALPPAQGGLVPTVILFAVLPFLKGDFGQREHLIVLMTLPYVIAAAAWLRGAEPGVRSRVAIGLVGGLGFAMKPQYLIGWVGIEIAVALAARMGNGHELQAAVAHPRTPSWRRTEVVAAALSLLAYGVAVVVLVPQYLSLASVVRSVYGGLDSSSAALLRITDVQVWILCLVLLCLVRLPRNIRGTLLVLFGAATGFLLAAILQLKGWSYHLYPARTFMLLFFVTFVLAVLAALPALVAAIRGGSRGVVTAVVVVLLLWSGRYVLEARRPITQDLVAPIVDLLRGQGEGARLAVLSMRTIIYPAFPAVNYAHAGWSLRHNSLWFLPGLYSSELQRGSGDVAFRRIDRMSATEQRFFREIVDDLCAQPPEVLLIETPLPHAPAGRRSLDLAAYYGQDPRYRRLEGAYERLAPVGPFAAFRRAGSATCH